MTPPSPGTGGGRGLNPGNGGGPPGLSLDPWAVGAGKGPVKGRGLRGEVGVGSGDSYPGLSGARAAAEHPAPEEPPLAWGG